MNELILKSTEVNSTSIIPNFGAIMKMGKTFMFNEFLKYDDGKLAKFIATEKGIDEPAAKQAVAEWVVQLQADLDAGKTVVFGGVGELVKADGKLKFTAKTSASPATEAKVETPPPSPPAKEKEEPKEEKPVEVEVKEPKETTPKPPKEEKKSKVKLSSDYKAKEVVAKIATYTDKSDLIEFTRGDSRKTVVAALNAKLDELNGKKKEKEEEPAATEVKAPKNAITEVKQEKTKEPELPQEKEKEEKVETPPVVEEKTEPTKEVTPPAKEVPKEKEIEKEEKPSVVEQPPVKKEDPTIKEKAAAIEKPEVNKEEEEEAIAAIVNGVEKTEKENGKRKKRWILWVALILILAGGGTLGYLKKDMIMGWFDKKHEPKDLAEETDDSVEDQEHDKETTTPEENPETSDESTVSEETTDPVVEETTPETAVEEPVIEQPVVEEPEAKETPAISSSSEGSWHIVAGSYSSQENAENKVATLKSEGYSSAKVLGKYGGLYTVRVASYNSKDEAKSALESYTSAGNKGFVKKL